MKKHQLHEKTDFTSVRHLVEWSAEQYGDRALFSFRAKAHDAEATSVSFLAVRDDVRALACKLSAMGCAGKHCVVIGKLTYDWAILYYSLLSIGAVLVPLDPEWAAPDLADTASKAEASFLFIEENIAEKAPAISYACNLLCDPIVFSAKDAEAGLTPYLAEGRELFAQNPDVYFEAEIDPYALALLVFTSGTTGKGKGVMLSQNAVLSDLSDVIQYVDFGKKTIAVLPPHHTYGSSVMLVGHMMIGCEMYISSGLRYITRELKEQEPEHLVLVPLYLETFYRKILATVKEQGKEKLLFKMIAASNSMRRVGIDLRTKLFASVRAAFGGKVKMIISGGAPINPEILSFFDAIGISTLNGYGITECAPIIAVNRSKNIVPGSVGNVLDIDTVRIEDPNEDGEGEICVKGSNVMLGYFKDPDATAEAIDKKVTSTPATTDVLIRTMF